MRKFIRVIIDHRVIWPIVGWTLLLGLNFAWHYWTEKTAVLDIALAQAKASVEKDLTFRAWASQHGGVYVPTDQNTPPNPFLDYIVERDIVTPSGKELTLLNPTYMTRQINALVADRYGQLGHVTSLNLLRPENAPDTWEKAALESFETGNEEVFGLVQEDEQRFFRYMHPLEMLDSCIPCHGQQGYTVGDIGGGISITIPMEPIDAISAKQLSVSRRGYAMLWFIGVIAIYLVNQVMSRRKDTFKELRADLDRKIKIHSVLHKVTAVSLHIEDMEEFFEEMRLAINDYFPLSSFSIGLADPIRREINFIFSVDTESDEKLGPIPFDAGDSLAAWVVRENKVLFKSGSDLRQALDDGKARLFGKLPHGWLGVPLKDSHRSHGLFMVQFYDKTETISEEDLDFFNEIALRLHMVIESWQKSKIISLNEKRLRAITDTAKDAICMIDPKGRLSVINPAGLEMFGYVESEMIGQPVHELIMPEMYRETQQAAFQRFQQSGTGAAVGKTVELTAKNKTGETFPIEISLSAVEMEDGWNAIAIIRDISARAKALETMAKLRAVTEQNEAAIIIADDLGNVEYVNPSFRVITGYDASEILGKNWMSLTEMDDFSVYGEDIADHLAGNKPWKKRRKSQRKDGTIFDDETIVFPIMDPESSELKNIVISRRDITNEMTMEEQLQQSQKLESIGQLAAGIAHEINTPTQYVNDNIQFLSDAYRSLKELLDTYDTIEMSEPDCDKIKQLKEKIDYDFTIEELPAAFDQSIEGIERVAKIIKAIKEFSHPGEKKMKLLDINRAIETTITIARNEWKYVALMKTEFDSQLPMVECFPGEINQVILNLIINAAHAIGDALKEKDMEKGEIQIQTHHKGDRVVITVSDNGTGIPVAVQQRVFDPFFTTKSVGQGTGQGLSLAHMTIVSSHKGELYFETKPGKGTTFYVELPIIGETEEVENA